MAKQKNDSPEENNVDLETLQENLKGLEIEKNMLKEQKERLENEKKKIEEEHNKESKEHEDKVKSLEEKIQKLESEKKQLQQDKENLEQQTKQVSENQPETTELQKKLDKASQENSGLIKERDDWRKKAENLSNQLQEQANKKPAGLALSPFIMQFLEMLAEKLSRRLQRDITPVEIVEDYVISYNLTKKWTEIFHPWVDMRKEAIEIAHSINPDIKTLEDLKTALHLK